MWSYIWKYSCSIAAMQQMWCLWTGTKDKIMKHHMPQGCNAAMLQLMQLLQTEHRPIYRLVSARLLTITHYSCFSYTVHGDEPITPKHAMWYVDTLR